MDTMVGLKQEQATDAPAEDGAETPPGAELFDVVKFDCALLDTLVQSPWA